MTASLRTIVLDSEAVSAAARDDARIKARLEAAARLDQRVVVPAVVAAELFTGRAGDARLHRVLNLVSDVVPVDRSTAVAAGILRERAEHARRKKRNLTVDAIVAAVAREAAPTAVLTADVDDLSLLCDGADVTVLPATE
ncbi:hypothetical protein GCM10027059_08800 [Myceligenerans halotolerans]